jgi:UDP-N-acetylglucosamine 2-epimerase
MFKALIVIGTRPELVKVAPLIQEMKKRGLRRHLVVVNTGQHKELMTNTFRFMGIRADYNLQLMIPGQNLNDLTARALSRLQQLLNELKEKKTDIGMMLAQGDTTSAFASAITAFHNKIPFGHIEAGLRTGDLQNPFPEEYYRRSISICTDTHFAPTLSAQQNLLSEGVPPEKIILTGNTVVDCLLRLKKQKAFKARPCLFGSLLKDVISRDKIVLITCHRRENGGENIRQIISAIKTLAEKYTDHSFVWILHPNPAVKEPISEALAGSPVNLHLVDPLDHFDLVSLYSSVKIIITDSGGLQEEAPSFAIPVIILREATERIESVSSGYAFLCGANPERIIRAFEEIQKCPPRIRNNPYGDGKSAIRICDWLEQFLWAKGELHLTEMKTYDAGAEL